MIYCVRNRSTWKRYAKITSVADAELTEIIGLAQKHIRKCRSNEYKSLTDEILCKTKNAYEMSIVFDKGNVVKFRTTGTFDAIDYKPSELARMEGMSLIHNHPRDFGFSDFDVFLAFQNKLKNIIAFTATGVLYKLSIKSNVAHEKVMLEYSNASDKAESILRRLIKSGKLSRSSAQKERPHFIMSIFASSIQGVSYERREH